MEPIITDVEVTEVPDWMDETWDETVAEEHTENGELAKWIEDGKEDDDG